MARSNGYSWPPGVRRESAGGGELQENNPLPLSDAQLGIWFAQSIDPSSPAYNLAEYLEIAGPTDATLLAPNTPTWIAGWGLSGTLRKLKRTPVLRRGATFVQERLYCRNHARAYYPFFNYSSQLCTITPPGFSIGTCHGDSGGPALAFREDGTPVQIGITSLGAADCDTHLPDIFTRIDRIYPWIAEQVAVTAAG